MLNALSAIALAIALPTAAYAQAAQDPGTKSAQTKSMTCLDHSKMAGMDQMKMDRSRMGGMEMPAMNHSKMGSCAMPSTGGSTSDHQGRRH